MGWDGYRVRVLHQRRPGQLEWSVSSVQTTCRILVGYPVLGPKVHIHNGRFYMFATFAKSAHTRPRGVAVLVPDDATGPFEPWSDGPVTPIGQPCVDGTLHVDADGNPWLIYGRGAEGTPRGEAGISDGEMYALRLSPDLKSPVAEPILLFRASSASWSVPMRFPDGGEPPEELNLAKDPRFTDGPFVVQAPGTPLRMLWSSHGKNGYTLGVATSASGLITGPWVQHDETLWGRQRRPRDDPPHNKRAGLPRLPHPQ
ncbi:family 43 glycosylhydrolase [Arthrobacter sp. NPDC058130]|uniref:family 43 glycosylhydrolase n=1 Tax=Arthrobacter sp. NPDC058130 TaxID=3346353 RepID=UPI0036E32023